MLCAVCCVLCAVCCVLCACAVLMCSVQCRCCVLCAVCCVLCAVCCCVLCCVLCAVCCVLCAVCCVLCAVCCVCCVLCAVCCVLCAVCTGVLSACAVLVCCVLCAVCCVWQKNAARRLLKMVSAIAPLLLAASQFVSFFKTHFITFYKVIFLLFVIFTGFQTSSGSLKPLLALFLQLCSLAAPGFFSLSKNMSHLPELKAGLASAFLLWTSMSFIPDCLSLRHQEACSSFFPASCHACST